MSSGVMVVGDVKQNNRDVSSGVISVASTEIKSDSLEEESKVWTKDEIEIR